jgi:hypothetical protein
MHGDACRSEVVRGVDTTDAHEHYELGELQGPRISGVNVGQESQLTRAARKLRHDFEAAHPSEVSVADLQRESHACRRVKPCALDDDWR